METRYSIASPATTGSKLTGVLHGVDTSTWAPADESEAQDAVRAVGAFCRDYCPVRLACVEDACQLYRLEGRSLEALGLRRDAATEAVGVLGQPVTGL